MLRAPVYVVAAALGLIGASAAAQVAAPPPPPPPPPPGMVAFPGQREVAMKTGTATIRGRVVAAGTSAPVPRVEVRITTADSPATKATTTDANGRYELTALPAGKFNVSAFKQNYIRISYGQTKPNGQGVPIELADGQVLQTIDFALQRAGAITGRILDEFGEPVVDVQVMTLRQQYVNGERRMMPSGGRPAMTNDLGEYRVYGLAPGQYFLSATLRNTMVGDADDRFGYAATFYPGTGSAAEAQRISIAPAQIVSGVNMTLLPVRTSRITGKATDAQGRPLVGAMVMAMERGGPAMGMRSPAQVRADGSFTLNGLTPGEYVLRVGVPGNEESATDLVSVSGGDISDVQLVAGRGATIRGRILIDSGAPPPKPSILNVMMSSSTPMMGAGAGRVNDDYTFEIRTTPGHGTITARGQDWRLHAVRLNGVDITDSGLDAPANGVIDGVVIELTQRVTEVTGRVLDDAGRPLRDVWVVLFAQDPLRLTPPSRFISAGRPNANNEYRVAVPAGDYFAIAVDDVEPGEWNDPDFLARARDQATRVTIAEGERKELDLKLAR